MAVTIKEIMKYCSLVMPFIKPSRCKILLCKDSDHFLEDSCSTSLLAEGYTQGLRLPRGPFSSPVQPKDLEGYQESPNLGGNIRIPCEQLLKNTHSRTCS